MTAQETASRFIALRPGPRLQPPARSHPPFSISSTLEPPSRPEGHPPPAKLRRAGRGVRFQVQGFNARTSSGNPLPASPPSKLYQNFTKTLPFLYHAPSPQNPQPQPLVTKLYHFFTVLEKMLLPLRCAESKGNAVLCEPGTMRLHPEGVKFNSEGQRPGTGSPAYARALKGRDSAPRRITRFWIKNRSYGSADRQIQSNLRATGLLAPIPIRG
jgi:hypothetical protein